jgi:hypothetical protein
MWVYPGPSCPNNSFFAELDDKEVHAQIRRVLIHGANRNSGPSLIPLRERAVSPSVSWLNLIPS